MPLHDWTRVDAGIWHAFHQAWVTELSGAFNEVLPPDYYALPEQTSVRDRDDRAVADILTLRLNDPEPPPGPPSGANVATAPRAATVVQGDLEVYRRRKSVLAVRHASGDRVVALLEIVSPGNKSGRAALRDFVRKALNHLDAGVHLLIADPFPPGRDPGGVHAAIWSEIEDTDFRLPAERPYAAVAYEALPGSVRGYVEPLGLGEPWPTMPLFLYPGVHVPVPLEATYMAEWARFPRRWRDVVAPAG